MAAALARRSLHPGLPHRLVPALAETWQRDGAMIERRRLTLCHRAIQHGRWVRDGRPGRALRVLRLRRALRVRLCVGHDLFLLIGSFVARRSRTLHLLVVVDAGQRAVLPLFVRILAERVGHPWLAVLALLARPSSGKRLLARHWNELSRFHHT